MMAEAEKHVFISHAAKDDAIGLRVLAELEAAGIKCWYSSRRTELEPGSKWVAGIVKALDNSVAVVVLVSDAANDSDWVARELVMSEKRGLPLYPIRIQDIEPKGALEAYLISLQYTNAFVGDLREALRPVVQKLLRPVVEKSMPTVGVPPSTPPTSLAYSPPISSEESHLNRVASAANTDGGPSDEKLKILSRLKEKPVLQQYETIAAFYRARAAAQDVPTRRAPLQKPRGTPLSIIRAASSYSMSESGHLPKTFEFLLDFVRTWTRILAVRELVFLIGATMLAGFLFSSLPIVENGLRHTVDWINRLIVKPVEPVAPTLTA